MRGSRWKGAPRSSSTASAEHQQRGRGLERPLSQILAPYPFPSPATSPGQQDAVRTISAGTEYTGEIFTLSLQAKGVRLVPDLRASGENSPSHRVLVGRAEIGAAWTKKSNEGREYLGLKLDDPSFAAPIYANLFDDEEGEGHSLIWSRPNTRRGE